MRAIGEQNGEAVARPSEWKRARAEADSYRADIINLKPRHGGVLGLSYKHGFNRYSFISRSNGPTADEHERSIRTTFYFFQPGVL